MLLTNADELGRWTGVDLSACGVKLHFHELLGQPQAQALSQFLRRTDVQLLDLHLNLSTRIDPATTRQLLSSVDRHAATLACPQILVEGAANGLLPKAFRLALAGSKVCLRDPHVRARIFLDLNQALVRAHEVVRQFLSVDTAAPASDSIEPRLASQLAGLAMEWGEGAVLRAVAVLSDQQMPMRLDRLPDQALDSRLEGLGVSFGLSLRLTRAQAVALGDWLRSERPRLKSLALRIEGSLDELVWMPIVRGLAAQASVQRVELQIANGVVLGWPALQAPPERSVARLDTLIFGLESSDANHVQTVVALRERLQPRFLRLQVRGFGRASPLLHALRGRSDARPLQGLEVDPAGAQDPGLLDSLQAFLESPHRTWFVSLCTRLAVQDEQRLSRLDEAASGNWQLKGFELFRRVPFVGLQSYHRFENQPLCLRLRRGPSEFAFGVGCLKGFFRWHGAGSEDAGEHTANLRLLEPHELRALACVSTHTQRMAIEARRVKQAEVIVAMVNEPELALDPPMLRALLSDPSGALDEALKLAVFTRLCEAVEAPAAWQLFEQALACGSGEDGPDGWWV